MSVDEAYTIDVGEAGTESRCIVAADAKGHLAAVVKYLTDDFGFSVFAKPHHVVHCEIGEGEGDIVGLVTLYYRGRVDGLAGRFPIGHDEPRRAKFDAAEIPYDYYKYVCQTE